MLKNIRLFHFIVIITIFVSSVYVIAESLKKTPQKLQLLNPDKTIQILKQHESDAIVIGKGSKAVYVFIDPLCEMSQMYVQLLYKNKERMLTHYKIYLFLYHLDGKPSTRLIPAILESDYPEMMLKQVMIEKRVCAETDVPDPETEDKIERIVSMAEKIGVYKRPYIISDGMLITGGE